MFRRRTCTLSAGVALFLLVSATPQSAQAGLVSLDFETFFDGTVLTNQVGGFVFANTSILSAGLSLNELEFPPVSGSNVATDDGGPVTVLFGTPVLSFEGFFTYSSSLSVEAFDSLDQPVGTANSAFVSNFVSTGNAPNELLQVSFAGGIARVLITGDPGGSSFVFDDISVETPDPAPAVPEPSTGLLLVAGIVAAKVLRARR